MRFRLTTTWTDGVRESFFYPCYEPWKRRVRCVAKISTDWRQKSTLFVPFFFFCLQPNRRRKNCWMKMCVDISTCFARCFFFVVHANIDSRHWQKCEKWIRVCPPPVSSHNWVIRVQCRCWYPRRWHATLSGNRLVCLFMCELWKSSPYRNF